MPSSHRPELTRHSYYAATAPRQQASAAAPGDHTCDVAVVGGGLAGLSAALELADRGFDVVLLEAREVGYGASGRNGGQAIHGLACDIDHRDPAGAWTARQVFGMSIEALDLIRQRIAAHDIDCDWRDGYLGVATSAGKALTCWRCADRTWPGRYGYPLRASRGRRCRSGSPARAMWRRARSALGPPAPAEVHAGPGPGRRAAGSAHARGHRGHRLRPGDTAGAAHRHGGARCRRARCCWPATSTCRALAPALSTRIMPVGTYIVFQRAVGAELARSAHPQWRRCATTTSCSTTSAPRPTTACSMAAG
jgi:gamma-glutamylputrescine oxidase